MISNVSTSLFRLAIAATKRKFVANRASSLFANHYPRRYYCNDGTRRCFSNSVLCGSSSSSSTVNISRCNLHHCPQQLRLFHSSTTPCLSDSSTPGSGNRVTHRRRRRRTGRDGNSTTSDESSASAESTPTIGGGTKSNQAYVFNTLDEFITAGTKCIDTMHNSLLPLQALNPNMILTRGIGNGEPDEDRATEVDETKQQYFVKESPTEEKVVDEVDYDALGEYLRVDLGPSKGVYVIQVHMKKSVVNLKSPISGAYSYFLSADGTTWICTLDGHHIHGMFVRDLIRQIHGVPNL